MNNKKGFTRHLLLGNKKWNRVFCQKGAGFTLIELLVVIAIIGLLATIAVTALNTARMKSRDAKRVGDIKQIKMALELFYNDNGRYPLPATASTTGPTPGDYQSGVGTTATEWQDYMSTYPLYPLPSNDGPCGTPLTYTYTQTGSGSDTGYTLTYCLGANTGGLTSGARTAKPSGL